MDAELKRVAIVLAILVTPILGILGFYFWNWLVNDFLMVGGLNTGSYSKNDQVYRLNPVPKPPPGPIIYKTPKTYQRTTLLAHERRMPPKAEFFGRLDGQEVSASGEYEEIYLNSFELEHWLRQKRISGLSGPDTTAKRAEMDVIDAKNEQNPEVTVHWGHIRS